MEWTRANISTTTHAWLAALPQRRVEGTMTLVHGSPLDPTWEYVTDERSARENIAALETTHGLHGHTHVPVAWFGRWAIPEPASRGRSRTDGDTRTFDGRRAFLNPGSVGQPRDGDPRASYLILDPDAGVATLAPRRLRHRCRRRRDGAPRACRPASPSGCPTVSRRMAASHPAQRAEAP